VFVAPHASKQQIKRVPELFPRRNLWCASLNEGAHMIKTGALLYLVKQGLGRTELELARAIHGPDGYQQQVNQDLALLVQRRVIERRGAGGAQDPSRYYAASCALDK
jgi:hypothetical protein